MSHLILILRCFNSSSKYKIKVNQLKTEAKQLAILMYKQKTVLKPSLWPMTLYACCVLYQSRSFTEFAFISVPLVYKTLSNL